MLPSIVRAGSARLPILTAVNPMTTTTSVCLTVGYGARHDAENRGGTAHLLEHLLLSTPVSGVRSFCETVERLGGYANAETGLEQMLFYAQVHTDDAKEVLDLLLSAALAPRFGQDALDRERDVVLRELAGAAADGSDAVQDLVLAALFPGHPLGRPVGGPLAEVSALTIDDVVRGHAGSFLASPMALVVVGPGEVEPGFDRAADLPPARVAPPAPLVPPIRRPVRWTDEYTWVCCGARTPPRDDPARHAYTVLANLLGGSPSSLLYRRLRTERGLAYSFQSWHRGYAEAGALRTLIGVDGGRRHGDEVVGVLREAMTVLAESGPPPNDLRAAVRQAEMQLIVDAERPLDLCLMVAQRIGPGPVAWDFPGELAALRTVTADQVSRAAARALAGLVVTAWPEAEQ